MIQNLLCLVKFICFVASQASPLEIYIERPIVSQNVIADGNISTPFSSLTQASDYLKSLSTETPYIDLFLIVSPTSYPYFLVYDPNWPNNPNGNYLFNQSTSQISIETFYNTSCTNCTEAALVFNDSNYFLLVNQGLMLSNVQVILEAYYYTNLFVFNPLSVNNYIIIADCNISGTGGSILNTLIGYQNNTSANISMVMINRTLFANIELNYGLALIYTSILPFQFFFDGNSISNIGSNNYYAFFCFQGNTTNGLVFIRNLTAVGSGTNSTFLYVYQNFVVVIQNISVGFQGPTSGALFYLQVNNSLFIMNSSFVCQGSDSNMAFFALSNNNISINESVLNSFGFFYLNQSNFLQCKDMIFSTTYYLLWGFNNNTIIFNNVTTNILKGANDYQTIFYLAEYNLLIMNNSEFFILRNDSIGAIFFTFYFIAGEDNNGLILDQNFMLYDNYSHYAILNFDNSSNTQIQVAGNNNCTIGSQACSSEVFLFCSSPDFLDNSVHCSNCSNVISGCYSCVLGEDLTPFCLSFNNTSNNNNNSYSVYNSSNGKDTTNNTTSSSSKTTIIIAIIIPLIVILILTIICIVWFRFYRKKKAENSKFKLKPQHVESAGVLILDNNINSNKNNGSNNLVSFNNFLDHASNLLIQKDSPQVPIGDNDIRLEITNHIDVSQNPTLMNRFCKIKLDLSKDVKDLENFLLDLQNRGKLTIYKIKDTPEELKRMEDLYPYERLGIGGAASVYKARKANEFNEVYALKLFCDALDVNHEDTVPKIHELIEEVVKLKESHHVFIIDLYGIAYSIQGSTIKMGIVEELMDQDLKSYIQKNRKSINLFKKMEIAANLLKAFYDFHKKGFIHQDVKPQNILINNKDLKLKISDMGATMKMGRLGNNNNQLKELTEFYSSPENLLHYCFENEPFKLDAKNDVWSLGLILFNLFIGKFNDAIPWIAELKNEEKMRSIIKSEENKKNEYCKVKNGVHVKIVDMINRFLQVDMKRRLGEKEILEVFLECRKEILEEKFRYFMKIRAKPFRFFISQISSILIASMDKTSKK